MKTTNNEKIEKQLNEPSKNNDGKAFRIVYLWKINIVEPTCIV